MPVRAQSGFIEHVDYFGASVEVMPAVYQDDAYTYRRHGGAFLSARLPLFSRSDALVLELPIGYHGGDYIQNGEAWATIGNPYVGISNHRSGNRTFVTLGARLPLAETDGRRVNDLLDVWRSDAFADGFFSVRGTLHKPWTIERVLLTVGGGPSILATTEGSGYAMLSFLTDLRFAYLGERLGIAGALKGTTPTHAVTAGFPGRLLRQMTAQMELAVSYRWGRVRPGIHIRSPLYDAYRPTTWGVTLRIYAGGS